MSIVEILGERPRLYAICDYSTAKYWTKLPSEWLMDKDCLTMPRLRRLSNRNPLTADALQLYLYLAAIVDRRLGGAHVTYQRICDVLGLSRARVSTAIEALVQAELIAGKNADFKIAETLPGSFFKIVGL